ncbi:sugar ABC transporter ATP-binding protein [Bryobacter aggregatus]|uniref:sugar ABC transporter ATP-binding protein n=1 Tax=Bryobacter aggregatus TaxID=360054 RepID=UPI000B2F4F15|nr:sugar ABC transporter ATP-binding protein [Bryobacter aggregatus]
MQKRFGGVTALRNGNLAVRAGEVHLLMGENGAGKSTMMKIVAGMQRLDGGEMLFRGQKVDFLNPKESAASGIAMVHQESLLAPHLSVGENIFLGREEMGGFGIVKRAAMMERASQLIEQHGFPLQANWKVEKLSPAGRQLVEICRAIANGTSLLIFDEPTSSLSEGETKAVFEIVQKLKQKGAGVIYITHRLEELRTLGDRVTVLRDGATVHSCDMCDLSRAQLIQHMVGRDLGAMYSREALPPGTELLRVEGLRRGEILRDLSLTVRAGEIVGLAGLMGAGRTELCRAIFGIDRFESGTVSVGGKVLSLRSPRDAVKAGIALIPEDRQRTGLATQLPVGWNLTLASVGAHAPMGILNKAALRETEQKYIEKLRIKTDGPGQKSVRLSGGNQQKIVIAKWVAQGARVFLFDEPTRGIDVGAKTEVFETMDELARQGAAVLMVSSELPELIQVADRILVMRQGKITGELPGKTTQEEIMALAAFEEEAKV